MKSPVVIFPGVEPLPSEQAWVAMNRPTIPGLMLGVERLHLEWCLGGRTEPYTSQLRLPGMQLQHVAELGVKCWLLAPLGVNL